MSDEGQGPKSLADAAVEQLNAMAVRVGKNADAFAGAFVICPPSGDPVTMLILDARRDAAVFWGLLKSHCEMAIDDLNRNPQTPSVHNTPLSWRSGG